MRKFLLAIFALVMLAALVSCGRSREQDIDFRAIRDVVLGVDISLGMTLSDVEDLLEQSPRGFTRSKEDGTTYRQYRFDNGIIVNFVDNMVIHIQASSPLGSERFEVLGHRIGDKSDSDWTSTRSYSPDGGFVPHFIEDVYVLSRVRILDGTDVVITVSVGTGPGYLLGR